MMLAASQMIGDDGGDDADWERNYGALVICYEESGRPGVPPSPDGDGDRRPDSPGGPSLRRLREWADEQRSAAGAGTLSGRRRRKLELIRFPFDGGDARPDGEAAARCAHAGCGRYGPFDGRCHVHFRRARSGDGAVPADATGAGVLPPDEPPPKRRRVPPSAAPCPPAQSPGRVPYPLVGLRRRTNGNYDMRSSKVDESDLTRPELLSRVAAYVSTLAARSCRDTPRGTPCDCLSILRGRDYLVESVAHDVLDYAEMSPAGRKHRAVERMRAGASGGAAGGGTAMLPLKYETLDEHWARAAASDASGGGSDLDTMRDAVGRAFSHRICRSAFCALYNIGPDKRKSLLTYASGDLGSVRHGNAGSRNRSARFAGAHASLRSSLDGLASRHAHLRDPSSGEIVLPPSMSKRKWYEDWVAGRGWVARKVNTKTGQYDSASNFDLAPGFYGTAEEARGSGGRVAGIVVNWTSAARIWAEEYPHLRTTGRRGRGLHGGNYDAIEGRYGPYPRGGGGGRRRRTEGGGAAAADGGPQAAPGGMPSQGRVEDAGATGGFV